MTYVTGALLLLAIIGFQLSRASGTAVWHFVGIGFAAFVCLFVVRCVFVRIIAQRPARAQQVLTAMVAAAFVTCVALHSWLSGASLANEETLLVALLALTSATFVCREDDRSMRQIAALSVVVLIFSLPNVESRYRSPIVLIAILSGGSWLFASSNRQSLDRWAWGYVSLVLLMVIGVSLIAHRWVNPGETGNPWYAAWVPTSGGGEIGDENARRGTGDGPDEIAGASADSLGFDRGDTFSESGKDGLYDLWVESYGKPLTSHDQQKMIGLKPSDVRVVPGRDRENLKVGRTFEMRRERPPQAAPAQASEAAAEAKLWLKGPVPAYVPLAAFDDFDGERWQAIDPGKPSVPVRLLPDSNWMEVLHRPISPSFAGTVEHEIRLGTLGGNVLPMPPLVERFRMGRVNRPEFFATSRAGFIKLAHRTLPAGAMLNVVSMAVSPSRLVEVELALSKHTDPALFDTRAVDARVRKLAAEWAAGSSRGWRQVQQVVERLRDRVTRDPNASAPGTQPVNDLLFVSRKGTDYQIAAAAVMLLRSIDYPTRLVSGLYADAADLDPRSGFVALDAGDVHFWIELRLADGTWVTVDPTPGYPMLNLPKSPGERLAGLWTGTRRVFTAHAALLAEVTAGLTGIALLRRRLIDAYITAWCRLGGCSPTSVLRVIEWRARLAGLPRPAGMTAGCWLASLASDKDTTAFVHELNRHLYREGANQAASCLATKVRNAVLLRLTLDTLKAHRQETT